MLTVLFCDLADSTDLSTRLDPEDFRDLIAGYQEAAAAVIGRLGGFVAKYMGDGVLAYFGYPAAHEDDAERALRAGLELVRAVAAMDCPHGPLRVRIGVATGPVIVGDLIGEGSSREQAISGETPNLAARLQAHAGEGGVVIAASTRALTGGLFNYAPLGALQLKGFAIAQPAFRVMSANEGVGRFEALRSAQTPLVAREEELELLERRWLRAREGEPQIVLVSAEPGVGKSRLITAFRARIKGGGPQVFTAYCAPHAVDSAFYPVIRSLEASCGFASTDAADQRLVKIEEFIRNSCGDLPAALPPLISTLLSLPGEGRYPPLDLSPQQIKEEIIRALVQIVLAGARRRPAIEFFEDAHWIDPSSLEMLRARVRAQDGVPMMLVITYRPQFQPPPEWLGQPNVTMLALTRLRPVEAQTMIARIAGGKRLPETILRQIMEHADGVPLFIEEITRTVLDSGALRETDDAYEADGPAPAISVPPTLQASLLARLDRLSPIKEVAQIGAAIGREFPHALLAAVAERNGAALDDALRQLIEADLIFARGSGPDAAYVFKHALIQDIAYGAMLRRPRQLLHARIAEALKASFAAQAEARPELLAYHLDEAGQAREAVDAWRRAAIKTLRGGSWSEGLAQLERGLRAAAALPDGHERDRLELDLQMMVGGVSQGAIGHSAPGAISAYARAYGLARRLEDRRVAALAGSRLWIGQYGDGDLEGVIRTIEATYDELAPTADPVELALVKSSATTTLGYIGRFVESQMLLDETSAAMEAHGGALAPAEYHFMSPLVHSRCAMVINELVLGRAQSWAGACCKLRQGLRDMGSMGGVIGLTMSIYAHYLARDWAGVKADAAMLEQAISEIEGAAHYLDLVSLVRARIAVMEGGADAAAVIDLTVERPSYAFAMQHLPRYLMIAGDTHADAGRPERAQACYEEALKGGPHGSQQWLRSELLRRMGDLAAAASKSDAARARYEEALVVARGQGAVLFELRAALAVLRLSGEQERAGAAEVLAAVCARMPEPGPDLDEAMAAMTDLQASEA